MVPLPWRLLSVPPLTVMSSRVKLLLGWLSSKVMVAVCPSAKPLLLLLMRTVGAVVVVVVAVVAVVVAAVVVAAVVVAVGAVVVVAAVDVAVVVTGLTALLATACMPMLMDTALFRSAPSLFNCPAALVKRSLSTNTIALVAPAVGVKVAL